MFTTREAAIAVWMCLLLAFALTRPGARASFGAVIRSALSWRVMLLPTLMAVYTAATVSVLYAVGAWKLDLLKDTILWFVFSGLSLAFSAVLHANDGGIWRRLIVDQTKVVLVLECIVNTYTFSFPVELLLVPVLTIISMLDLTARSEAEYALVARFTGGLQTLSGFGVLAFATAKALGHLGTVQVADAIRAVLLPPTLAILILPFVYLLALAGSYESLLTALQLPKDAGIKSYAIRKVIFHLGLRLKRVRNFTHSHAWDLTRVKTRADVDALLNEREDVRATNRAGTLTRY